MESFVHFDKDLRSSKSLWNEEDIRNEVPDKPTDKLDTEKQEVLDVVYESLEFPTSSVLNSALETTSVFKMCAEALAKYDVMFLTTEIKNLLINHSLKKELHHLF